MKASAVTASIAMLALLAPGAALGDSHFLYVHSFFVSPLKYSVTSGYDPEPVVGHATAGDPTSWALYGIAAGGDHGNGLVYKLSPPPPHETEWKETRLYSFPLLPNYPRQRLIFGAAGDLFMTTAGYNAKNQECDTIVRLVPSPPAYFWRATTIYDACTSGRSSLDDDLVIDAGGTVYGTARYEGGALSAELFSLTPPASGHGFWTQTILHTFNLPVEVTSGLPLVLGPSGEIYGSAWHHVYHRDGSIATVSTVYRMSPPLTAASQQTFSTLYVFGENRFYPFAFLRDVSGSMFLSGEVFTGPYTFSHNEFVRLDPPVTGQSAWTENDLLQFDITITHVVPQSLARFDASGPIYGTVAFRTYTAGFSGTGGVVFRLNPPVVAGAAWTQSVVAVLGDASGALQGPLVRDPAGSLYTADTHGDSPFNDHDGYGTILKIIP